MKERRLLEKNWEIGSMEPVSVIDPISFALENWLTASTMPMEVHEILLEHGMLDPEYQIGWCRSAEWVTKLDWVYRLRFSCETPGVHSYLRFGGLDTFADIYLNGVKIG